MVVLYDKDKQRVVEVNFSKWSDPGHYSYSFDYIEGALFIKSVSTYCCIADLDEYMRFYHVSIVPA